MREKSKWRETEHNLGGKYKARDERKRERKKRESLEYTYRGISIYIYTLEVTFFSPARLCLITLTSIIFQQDFVNNDFSFPALL